MRDSHNQFGKWDLSSTFGNHDLKSAIWIGPSHDTAARGGIALLDAPNIRCAIYDLLGRHPQGAERLDARHLRAQLIEGCGIKRFVASYREATGVPRQAYGDYLRRSHWKVHTCTTPRFGLDSADPVDDLLGELIARQMQPEKDHRLVLCSHDGGFADSLRQFLSIDESRVWIVGFLERLSRKLVDLTGQTDRVRLVDIEHHAHALALPEGARSLPREMLTGVLMAPHAIPVQDRNRRITRSIELAV